MCSCLLVHFRSTSLISILKLVLSYTASEALLLFPFAGMRHIVGTRAEASVAEQNNNCSPILSELYPVLSTSSLATRTDSIHIMQDSLSVMMTTKLLSPLIGDFFEVNAN